MSNIKDHQQQLVEFENKLKEIHIEVGGCALLRRKNRAGYEDYILVEHPTEQRYLINKDMFYQQPLDIIDNAELIYKFEL